MNRIMMAAILAMAVNFTVLAMEHPAEGREHPTAQKAGKEHPEADKAAPEVGKPAPTFTCKNLDGETVALSDYKGKYVVLEWTNYDCPFVIKHYSTGNMPALQKEWMEKGVAWLVICSSAPGKQGHFPPEKWKELAAERESTPSAILLDVDGVVGKKYRARTTPHMFVINPEGILLYMGAIDDKPTTRAADVETATNHVRSALKAAMAGQEIDPAVTRPYGCAVHY